MVFGTFEPTASLAIKGLNARIALTSVGLVVKVGKDSLDFRVVQNPLTVNVFGDSIPAPKVCT